MALDTANLILRCGSLVIGEIVDAFWSEETGYGLFRPRFGEGSDPALARIREYIAFSEDWHSRLKHERPNEASEWDAFKDVYESFGAWNTLATDGTVVIIEAPVFVAGEVTWRLPG